MNKEEKIRFINELMDNLKKEIVAKVDRMPENWDGHELRQYIKDRTSEVVWSGTEMKGKRKREYMNTVLVNNL